MCTYSEMRSIDVWYSRIDYESSLQFVRRMFRWYIEKQSAKASQRTSSQAFPKLTIQIEGQHRIKDDPPLIMHLDDDVLSEQLKGLVEAYRPTIQEDRRVLLNKYSCMDVAQKVVGVGSVGTRCYVVLCWETTATIRSSYKSRRHKARYSNVTSAQVSHPNHAERVVSGQRLMQAASDLFLGWTSLGTTDFYIRQLRNMKLSVDLATLIPEGFIEYCRFCGWALARAHARSGDPALISGYLGASDVFDRAIATFAETYADQTERDHAAFVAAIQ